MDKSLSIQCSCRQKHHFFLCSDGLRKLALGIAGEPLRLRDAWRSLQERPPGRGRSSEWDGGGFEVKIMCWSDHASCSAIRSGWSISQGGVPGSYHSVFDDQAPRSFDTVPSSWDDRWNPATILMNVTQRVRMCHVIELAMQLCWDRCQDCHRIRDRFTHNAGDNPMAIWW